MAKTLSNSVLVYQEAAGNAMQSREKTFPGPEQPISEPGKLESSLASKRDSFRTSGKAMTKAAKSGSLQ